MKKIFLILCLAISSTPFAHELSALVSKPAAEEHVHNGNYFSFGFGLGFVSNHVLNIDRDDYDNKRIYDKIDYNGVLTPQAELRFGLAAANLFAAYTVFGGNISTGTADIKHRKYKGNSISNGFIDYELKESFETDNANIFMVRGYTALGFTLYPFKDEHSPMNGAFIGGSVGVFVAFSEYDFEIENDDYDYRYYDDDYTDGYADIGPRFEVEIGKEWWISRRLSVGFTLGYAYCQPTIQTERSKSSDHTAFILFRLTAG